MHTEENDVWPDWPDHHKEEKESGGQLLQTEKDNGLKSVVSIIKEQIAKHKDKVSDLMSAAKTHQDELVDKSNQIHKLETQKTDQPLQTEDNFKQLSAEKSSFIEKKNLIQTHNFPKNWNCGSQIIANKFQIKCLQQMQSIQIQKK